LKACVSEACQAAAISIGVLQSRARDLICSSEKCFGDYFFFFLPVFFAFFAFFAFLAMLPSSPKVGSLQVEHRRADDSVHHNRKIDTECFEQGKRRITPLPAARFAHMCRDETGRGSLPAGKYRYRDGNGLT
jgi:hypothetical protein